MGGEPLRRLQKVSPPCPALCSLPARRGPAGCRPSRSPGASLRPPVQATSRTRLSGPARYPPRSTTVLTAGVQRPTERPAPILSRRGGGRAGSRRGPAPDAGPARAGAHRAGPLRVVEPESPERCVPTRCCHRGRNGVACPVRARRRSGCRTKATAPAVNHAGRWTAAKSRHRRAPRPTLPSGQW